MRTVTSPALMQRLALQWQRRGARIGFVPTMGCLHDGHLSLVRRARQWAGPRGKVVVSIYVNPPQVRPGEDFARYPRQVRRDCRLCRGAGVDVVFLPTDAAMYPSQAQGRFSTYVVEQSLSRRMEGVARPGHFRGVTTVVAKLFHIVQPDVAVFGAKDWQQAAIIRRMVRDLNFPVKIAVAPTRREPDGLALSSRNLFLRGLLRAQATALVQAIRQARAAVRRARRPLAAARLRRELAWGIEQHPDARVDYIEFFKADSLEPLARVGPGAHMALAVFVGRTRLIDNGRL